MKERKEWLWETRNEARRVAGMLEEASDILEELTYFDSALPIRTQLLIAKHALLNEANSK